jgi:hypothetical protein
MPIVASSGAMRTRALQRSQPDAFDDNADYPAGAENDRHGQRQRRLQKGNRRPADVGAQSVDRAMREINKVGDAENQRQAHREQRVDVCRSRDR